MDAITAVAGAVWGWQDAFGWPWYVLYTSPDIIIPGVEEEAWEKRVGDLGVDFNLEVGFRNLKALPVNVEVVATLKSPSGMLHVLTHSTWHEEHNGQGCVGVESNADGWIFYNSIMLEESGVWTGDFILTTDDGTGPTVEETLNDVRLLTVTTTPVTCNEGQTKCINQDLYVCQREEWVLLEPNSASCGKRKFPWLLAGAVVVGIGTIYALRRPW